MPRRIGTPLNTATCGYVAGPPDESSGPHRQYRRVPQACALYMPANDDNSSFNFGLVHVPAVLPAPKAPRPPARRWTLLQAHTGSASLTAAKQSGLCKSTRIPGFRFQNAIGFPTLRDAFTIFSSFDKNSFIPSMSMTLAFSRSCSRMNLISFSSLRTSFSGR